MKAKAKVAIETLVKKQERSYSSECNVDSAASSFLPGKAGAEVTPSEPLSPR